MRRAEAAAEPGELVPDAPVADGPVPDGLESGGPAPIGLAETARAALDALQGGDVVVGLVVVEAGEAVERLGRRMLVRAGSCEGTLGSPALDVQAAALARQALASPDARAGVHKLSADRADHSVYIEVFRPPDELVIVGAGHIARPLCRLGALLGFRVSVLDDRPEFATRERFPEARRVGRIRLEDPFREVALGPATHLVLVTRGHKYDYDVLREVLRRPVAPAYIGMVGSRRRVRAAMEQLAREGVRVERLQRIHAPIGLDIGAETPEEIAVAIAAEIILLRRGGTGAPLRERARVVERWIEGRVEVNPEEVQE